MGALNSKEKIKSLILEVVAREKPENTQELKQMMQQEYGIDPEMATKLFIQLENEDKLQFTKPETSIPTSSRQYIFSKKVLWFWTIIGISMATAISVFTISETTYPITYLRNTLGLIFVLFLPGYTFIKVLFPTAVPSKTNIDNVERITLCLCLSLALVSTVSLLLNYSPWGIRLTPVILSILILTTVFATVAVVREYVAKAVKIMPSSSTEKN